MERSYLPTSDYVVMTDSDAIICLDCLSNDTPDDSYTPGGESDCPEFCSVCGDGCGNTLTEDGAEYLGRLFSETVDRLGRGENGAAETLRKLRDGWTESLEELEKKTVKAIAEELERIQGAENWEAIAEDQKAAPPCGMSAEDLENSGPYLNVTLGYDGPESWTLQIGDNSFTGSAYGYAFWGTGTLGPDEELEDLAEDLMNQALEQIWARI